MNKVVELVGGESVINGATPSSFTLLINAEPWMVSVWTLNVRKWLENVIKD